MFAIVREKWDTPFSENISAIESEDIPAKDGGKKSVFLVLRPFPDFRILRSDLI